MLLADFIKYLSTKTMGKHIIKFHYFIYKPAIRYAITPMEDTSAPAIRATDLIQMTEPVVILMSA